MLASILCLSLVVWKSVWASRQPRNFRMGLCGHMPFVGHKGRSVGLLALSLFLSQSYWAYTLASMPFPNLVLCGAIQARWSHEISKTGQMEECLGMLALI